MDKRKILSRLWDLDLYLSMLALAVLIFVTFLGVIMRYLANAPFVWLDEVQMICIVWAVSCGASAAFRHGGHIGIDMIVGLFPAALRKRVGAAVFLVVFYMLGFLAWNSYGLVRQQFVNSRVSDIMRLPRGFIYLPLPLAAAGMMAGYALNAVGSLRKARNVKEE